MLSPSRWPGWFRVALLVGAFISLFIPHVGFLTALALVGAAIISFRAAAASVDARREDGMLREGLLNAAVTEPVSVVEVEVEHPIEVVATAYHQDGISAVIEARAALAEPGEPLYAALELEPNNPFDSNAVRVDLLLFYGATKCGYLPPGLSRVWAEQIRPHALDAQQVVVAATIFGTGSRSDPYRVRLG